MALAVCPFCWKEFSVPDEATGAICPECESLLKFKPGKRLNPHYKPQYVQQGNEEKGFDFWGCLMLIAIACIFCIVIQAAC